MSKVLPNRKSLHADYQKHLPLWSLTALTLEKEVHELLQVLPSEPRVKGRVKSFESYFKKYVRLLKAGDFDRINDLIGVRVICSFLEDLSAAEELIKKHFKVIEIERKGWGHTIEFGYESTHLLIEIPEKMAKSKKLKCDIAEIQVRTILQDVWAEVEHELIYKVEFTPFDAPLRRKLAAINASLSMADILFQDIRSYQRRLNGEMGKRRDSFFQKIEESTDAVLFKDSKKKKKQTRAKRDEGLGLSMDDLLLEALSLHNENQFDEAIAIYSQILDMKPDDAVSALIFKHRGMAYFARSYYKEAIEDFSKSLKLDPKSYKAAYYEGIVHSVLQKYSKALDSFNSSLEINPYQPYCLFRRGQAYFHLEDIPKALADCESAISLEPFEAALKFRTLLLSKLKM